MRPGTHTIVPTAPPSGTPGTFPDRYAPRARSGASGNGSTPGQCAGSFGQSPRRRARNGSAHSGIRRHGSATWRSWATKPGIRADIPSGRIRRHVADCGASTGGFDSEPIGGWRSGRRSMLIGMAIRLIGTFADTAVVQRGSAWFSVVHPRYRVHSVGKTVDKPNREYPIFHCASITYGIRSRGSGNPETPAPARTRHPRTTGPGSPESHE